MKSDDDKDTAVPPQAPSEAKREIMLHGIPASPGIAIGLALAVGDSERVSLEPESHPITESEVPNEINRFTAALEKTRRQIMELQKRVQSSLQASEASIFDAHLLIVDDKVLTQEVISEIRKRLQSANVVFCEIIRRYIAAISAVDDQYLKERASDVADVAYRILENLNGQERQLLDHLPGQRIVISRDLTPSDTALLDRENVQAFATETGSRTSHTAILARSMKIPAVVGLNGICGQVHNGDMLIIDGFLGAVILNPRQETLELYAQKEAFKEQLYNELQRESALLPETIDGYRVQLAANIDNVNNLDDILNSGAAGIGLFRTEYLFMGGKIPTEEEQFEVYRKIAVAMKDQTTIIRTLDLGGDKLSSVLNLSHDPNPFLGLRSIRLCLAYPELLIPQLRAVLRASAFGNIKMMFPMVTCEDELDKLLEILESVRKSLRSEKKKFDEEMEIGIMIETPAAALFAERTVRLWDAGMERFGGAYAHPGGAREFDEMRRKMSNYARISREAMRRDDEISSMEGVAGDAH